MEGGARAREGRQGVGPRLCSLARRSRGEAQSLREGRKKTRRKTRRKRRRRRRSKRTSKRRSKRRSKRKRKGKRWSSTVARAGTVEQ